MTRIAPHVNEQFEILAYAEPVSGKCVNLLTDHSKLH
jgi:hypothetical protein